MSPGNRTSGWEDPDKPLTGRRWIDRREGTKPDRLRADFARCLTAREIGGLCIRKYGVSRKQVEAILAAPLRNGQRIARFRSLALESMAASPLPYEPWDPGLVVEQEQRLRDGKKRRRYFWNPWAKCPKEPSRWQRKPKGSPLADRMRKQVEEGGRVERLPGANPTSRVRTESPPTQGSPSGKDGAESRTCT